MTRALRSLVHASLPLALVACANEEPTGFSRSVAFTLEASSPAATLTGTVVALPEQPDAFRATIRGVAREQRADLHPLLFLTDAADLTAPQLSLSLLRERSVATYAAYRWGSALRDYPEFIATYKVPEAGGVRHYEISEGSFVIEALEPAARGHFRLISRGSYFIASTDPVGLTYMHRPESLVVEGRFDPDR